MFIRFCFGSEGVVRGGHSPEIHASHPLQRTQRVGHPHFIPFIQERYGPPREYSAAQVSVERTDANLGHQALLGTSRRALPSFARLDSRGRLSPRVLSQVVAS